MFFVAVDWFFCSHFLERAIAAKDAGYDVTVITHVKRHGKVIESSGLRVIPLHIDRRSLNPVVALNTLWELIKILRSETPDILHQVALKPILLGSLAARFANIKHIVNAVVGGGYVFTSASYSMRAIRPFLSLMLRLLLNPKGSRVVFENSDDLATFVQANQVRAEDAILIRGAGVNVDLYRMKSWSHAHPLVVLPARILWDKGVADFVDAARLLRRRGTSARFALVGDVDPDNRASIDSLVLDRWRDEGVVEMWGFRQDMPQVLAEADIVCLPSYREGLPKALLEAMAAGLPCVTTDVPGCREVVRNGENGLLVPPRDPVALADALARVIEDPGLCKVMGLKGRERVMTEFSSLIVCRQTLQVYDELIAL